MQQNHTFQIRILTPTLSSSVATYDKEKVQKKALNLNSTIEKSNIMERQSTDKPMKIDIILGMDKELAIAT